MGPSNNTPNANEPGESRRPNPSQGDINQAFADIALEEEGATNDDPQTITRPSGMTQTSFYDGDHEVTLWGAANMTPDQRAAAVAKNNRAIQTEFGRTNEEQERLRAAFDDAAAKYAAAREEDKKARRDDPGSGAQLAALVALESARDAYNAAVNAYLLNDFEPIVRHASNGMYVNGGLAPDEPAENT